MRTRGTGSVAKLNLKQANGSRVESRYWYIWFYNHNGVQIRESSHSESKIAAEQLLQRRLQEIGRGVENPQNARKLKYEDMRAELVQEYRDNGHTSLTKDADGNETIQGLQHLDAFFSGMTVAHIKTDTLKKFRSERLASILNDKADAIAAAIKKEPEREKEIVDRARLAANNTINRNVSLIRRMFNIQREGGKLEVLPYFPMTSEAGNERQGFVEPADFAKVMAHIPDNLKPLLWFLYFTGCRIGAALQIKWTQIEVTKDRVFLRVPGTQTKSGEPLLLPLPKELADMLRKTFRKADAPVFDGTGIQAAWRWAVEMVFMDGLVLHDLRRSGIKNLIDAGVDRDTAMKISGHKTEYVFRRYNIVDNTRLADAMQKVETKNAEKLALAQATAS